MSIFKQSVVIACFLIILNIITIINCQNFEEQNKKDNKNNSNTNQVRKELIFRSDINDYRMNNPIQSQKFWQLFTDHIQNISLLNPSISASGYKKLFQKLDSLSNIKYFEIKNSVLNRDIIKIIFHSQTFRKIKYLLLLNTGVTDQWLNNAISSLPQQKKQVSIEYLYLYNNKISKLGFKALSLLKYKNKLKMLNIDANSLIYDESIESIIQMDLSRLQRLNVASTRISQQNLFKLLDNINKEEIKQIKIDNNIFDQNFMSELDKKLKAEKQKSLTQQQKLKLNKNYQKYFNMTEKQCLWKRFTQYKFPKLQNLTLSLTDLDEQHTKYFIQSNWTMPNLKLLNLDENFIDDQFVQKVLNQKRLPLLNILYLRFNPITHRSLKHIVSQPTWKFRHIHLERNKLNNQSLSILSQLNLNYLQEFYFADNKDSLESFKIFFSKQFPQLVKLTINRIQKVQGFQKFIKYMPKLKYLFFQNMKFNDVYFLINGNAKNQMNKTNKKILFPMLQQLHLPAATIIKDDTIIQFVLSSISKYPNLNLLSLSNIKKLHQLQYQINAVAEQIFKSIKTQDLVIELNTIIFKIKNRKLYISLMSFTYLKEQIFNCQQIENKKQCASNNMKDLFNIFEFEEINMIAPTNYQERIIYEQILLFLKKSNINVLKNVTAVSLQGISTSQDQDLLQKYNMYNDPTDFFDLVNDFTLPRLKAIRIGDDSYIKTLKKYRISKQAIKQLYDFNYQTVNTIQIEMFKQKENRVITKFFLQNKFPLLNNLIISQSQMQDNQFQQIMRSLKHSPLNLLNVGGNLLNSKFGSVIKQLNIPFSIIIFQFIRLAQDQFQAFGESNLQFLKKLDIMQVNLNNQKIKLLTKNKEKAFPFLQELTFGNDPINLQGLKNIFQCKLNYLQTLTINNNGQQDLFGAILNYNPRRLKELAQNSNYLNSHEIFGSRKCTRRINTLQMIQIQTSEQNFKILRQFNWDRLQSLTYVGKSQKLSCEGLKTITKIGEEVNAFTLQLAFNYDPLDDSCFENFTVHMQRLRNFIFARSNQEPNYVPYWMDNIISQDQNLQILAIVGLYFNQEKLQSNIQILKQNLIVLVISNNFTDNFLSKLLDIQIVKGVFGVLVSNQPLMTQKSLESWRNQNLNVFALDFSRTSIGDQGIQILSSLKGLDLLRTLNLMNIGMTSYGLKILFNMSLPNLEALDISNNDFSQKELLEIDFKSVKVNRLIVASMRIHGDDYDIILQKGMKNHDTFTIECEKYNVDEEDKSLQLVI